MRLTELEPRFLKHEIRDGRQYNTYVETLAEAHGIIFDCPSCFAKNNGPVGTHAILVTFADRGVPDELGSHGSSGNPSRWTVTGSGHHDLTLSPSIDVSQSGDGEWHGWITNGEIK